MSLSPRQTLPASYRPAGTMDLSRNRGLALAVNLAALGLFFGFGWLFARIGAAVRPDMAGVNLEIGGWLDLVKLLALLFLLVAGQVAVHELIHGLFFQFYTGARPHYAFKGLYAYAAAPGWYLPRNPYLVTALAPFVLITLAGLLLLPFLPAGFVLPLLLGLTLNAAGAVGDLLVAGWLLIQPPSSLIHDNGDAISLYRPG